MPVRFGGAPIAWLDGDLPALGADAPLATVLGDTRDNGRHVFGRTAAVGGSRESA